MEINELILILDKIAKISNEEWLSKLEERKLLELEFHNRDRDEKIFESLDKDSFEKYYGNKKYYRTIKKSTDYVENWIKKNAQGKVFLDYACGNANNALMAASAGAKLAIGLDISDVSIENAKKKAKDKELNNTYFLQADAEDTKIPDSSVDTIICSGMLHHLDLSYAFPELRRILAPNGKILAVEALEYNPFIKLYRMLTPDMRTEWEKHHILGQKDLRFAEHFFDVKNIKYWHVTSYLSAKIPFSLKVLNSLDSLLTKIPIVKLMAWIFTFELHSQKKINNNKI